jgi:hypothetical protein
MAHFAQLDQINVVTQVIVVHNNELVASKQTTVNEDGSVSVSVIESEDKGIEFCKSLFGADTKWVQTSYNASFRGKYAGIGDTYDAANNICFYLLSWSPSASSYSRRSNLYLWKTPQVNAGYSQTLTYYRPSEA